MESKDGLAMKNRSIKHLKGTNLSKNNEDIYKIAAKNLQFSELLMLKRYLQQKNKKCHILFEYDSDSEYNLTIKMSKG